MIKKQARQLRVGDRVLLSNGEARKLTRVVQTPGSTIVEWAPGEFQAVAPSDLIDMAEDNGR